MLNNITLFHFNLKFGDMGISKKGRLKYSESDSIFVYLADKGGSFSSNLPNFVPARKKFTKKTQNIFTHMCRGQIGAVN